MQQHDERPLRALEPRLQQMHPQAVDPLDESGPDAFRQRGAIERLQGQNQFTLSTTFRSGRPSANARQLSTMICNRRSSRYGPNPAV